MTPANIGAAASSHSHTEYAAASHTHSDYASSTHNHDSSYAAKSHSHSEYAASSHGNHVPTTQTANNAKFLRCDNSWQTVTPANIGAAASSHTHDYAPLSGATFTGNITAPIYRGAWAYAFQSTTAAGTQVKAATRLANTIPAFVLEANLVFVLYLAASNTAETPKLNVLSTGEMTFKTSGGKDVPAKALVVGRYILLTGGGSPPSNVFILSGPEGYYKALLGV